MLLQLFYLVFVDKDINITRKAQKTRYLEQLVSQIGLNQPVVHGDVEELVLRPLGQTERLLKLQVDNNLLMQTTDAAFTRKEAAIVPTHVSCSFLVTEHVGVRCHDRRPGLFRDTGGLRGSFALVHQLLHCVCDAFVTQQSGTNEGKVKNTTNMEL